MTTSAPRETTAPTKSADDFGDGLFDEPVVKPAARAAHAPTRTSAPALAPAKVEPNDDEDDGFGAGLV